MSLFLLGLMSIAKFHVDAPWEQTSRNARLHNIIGTRPTVPSLRYERCITWFECSNLRTSTLTAHNYANGSQTPHYRALPDAAVRCFAATPLVNAELRIERERYKPHLIHITRLPRTAKLLTESHETVPCGGVPALSLPGFDSSKGIAG
jgi:hypothetical protein